MMKCENCAYFWKEDYEERPSCHWEIRCPGDQAPCEEDEYWEEEDSYDWPEDDEEDIEDIWAMNWVDAWKNGDYDEEGRMK